MLSPVTCDHASVFFWAERHEAVPAEVLTDKPDVTEPTLSFLFRRNPHITDSVRPISWNEFFAVFDLFDLSFACEEDPTSPPRFLLGRWPRHVDTSTSGWPIHAQASSRKSGFRSALSAVEPAGEKRNARLSLVELG